MTIDFSRPHSGSGFTLVWGLQLAGLSAGTMGISDVFAQAMAGLGGLLNGLAGNSLLRRV